MFRARPTKLRPTYPALQRSVQSARPRLRGGKPKPMVSVNILISLMHLKTRRRESQGIGGRQGRAVFQFQTLEEQGRVDFLVCCVLYSSDCTIYLQRRRFRYDNGWGKAENRRKIVAVIHISIQEKIVLSRRVRAVPEYSVQFDDKTRRYHIYIQEKTRKRSQRYPHRLSLKSSAKKIDWVVNVVYRPTILRDSFDATANA